MAHFALMAFERCQAGGIATATDCLQLVNILWERAGGEKPLFTWQVLTPDGKPVVTASGLKLHSDGKWQSAADSDVVFVPALYYSWTREFVREVAALRNRLELLCQLHKQGTRIAACCTGTFLLAESGLLDGRRGTTTWWLRNVFSERYPKVDLQPGAVITEDDGVYCSGPDQSRANLLIMLMEPFAGHDLALLAAKVLLVDTNSLSQAPYVTLQAYLGHQDRLVQRAQQLMQLKIDELTTINEIAELVGTSPRTLIRRFQQATGQTPSAYLRSMRLDLAKRLLESTDQSLEQIAGQVGYTDAGAFRKLFQRATGLSPREFRVRFSSTGL